MEPLRLCASCKRHVLVSDAACPFCGATPGPTKAVKIAAAAVIAATSMAVTATTLGCGYGAPVPPTDAGHDASAGATDSGTTDQ
jgi:hypothetical protein